MSLLSTCMCGSAPSPPSPPSLKTQRRELRASLQTIAVQLRATDCHAAHASSAAAADDNESYDWGRSSRDNYQVCAGDDPPVYAPRFEHIRRGLDEAYHGRYTLARQAVQDELIADVLRLGVREERPWIVFTAGAMGAGKSFTMSW